MTLGDLVPLGPHFVLCKMKVGKKASFSLACCGSACYHCFTNTGCLVGEVMAATLDHSSTLTIVCLYSTKMLFFVQNEPPHQLFKGHEVAAMLKSELRKQKADFLIFRALEINTVSESREAGSKALRQTTFHLEGDSYPRAQRPLTVLREL